MRVNAGQSRAGHASMFLILCAAWMVSDGTAPPETLNHGPGRQKMARILIVDDDPGMLTALRSLFESDGYEAVTVEDGRQAVDLMKSESFDLLLSDVRMSPMDGIELLKAAKSIQPNLPVVMLTAYASIGTAVEAVKLGALDYIQKPLNMDKLLISARRAVEYGQTVAENLNLAADNDRLEQAVAERTEELRKSLKELEVSFEDLKRAEKARDALVHMIVHDINNPLLTISLSTQMIASAIEKGALTEEELRSRLKLMERPLARLQAMSADILYVYKIEDGKMEVKLTPVSISELASLVEKEAGLLAERADMELVFDPVPADLVVHADRNILLRILHNHLGNAFKYVPPGGQVRFGAERKGDRALLTVADNGPGIPDDFKDQVFDKFAQADLHNIEGRSGVGLGLAFCKIASEAMGGRVWVESEEAQGTVFGVELKAAD